VLSFLAVQNRQTVAIGHAHHFALQGACFDGATYQYKKSGN
jgi:hypothetical protein